MTDPIADMLTRIRNSYLVGSNTTKIPYSNTKLALAQKLSELGYLETVDVSGEKHLRQITVKLKYKNKTPLVTGLKRISKPGRRVYTNAKDIKPVLSGYGSTILSTSKGILSDKEAKNVGIGGEVICQVW